MTNETQSRGDPLLWIFAGILLPMWIVVLVVMFTPEAANSQGFPHPQFPTMDQGGDGVERHQRFMLTGWLFGSLQIAFFVGLLAWAMLRTSKAPLKAVLGVYVVGGLVYEAALAFMCLAYRTSLASSEVAFTGPFPTGVTWMLAGVWWTPAIFIVIYVCLFNSRVAPPETLQRFEQLIAEKANQTPSE